MGDQNQGVLAWDGDQNQGVLALCGVLNQWDLALGGDQNQGVLALCGDQNQGVLALGGDQNQGVLDLDRDPLDPLRIVLVANRQTETKVAENFMKVVTLETLMLFYVYIYFMYQESINVVKKLTGWCPRGGPYIQQ